MRTYFDVTKEFHAILTSDEDINTVTINQADTIDINKRTIFPLANIQTPTVSFPNTTQGIVQFAIDVAVLDILDIKKTNSKDENEPWKGTDNKQDILNSMLGVIENLLSNIRKGNLQRAGYDIEVDVTADQVLDEKENVLSGWVATFLIQVPNVVQNCE